MDNNLYSTIELSYALLNNKEAKSLLLHCALTDGGTSITFMCFLAYGMGLGLFRDVHKINDRMNRIKSLIDYLEASCLLLKGNNNEMVKMHNIAHMVVASIAKEKRMFNIQDANGFKEVLVKGMYKDSIAICLHHRDIDRLPERRDALRLLKSSNPRCVSEMDNTLYSTIELSYALLKSEEAKSLLLLCALSDVGTSISFMCFLAYGMGLGLFQEVHKIKNRMNRIKSLIDYLETSCLLLKDANGFKEVLVKGMYKDSIAICLHHGDIDRSPERLKSSNPRCVPEMDNTLYLTIELSYALLNNSIGLGYFQDVHTINDRMNRNKSLIDYLGASCLLLKGNNNETVKMHDIIHMAVELIAKEKRMFSIQDANGFKEVSVKGIYKDSISICLHHGDIDGLPERINFLNLQLLVLCLEKMWALVYLSFASWHTAWRLGLFQDVHKINDIMNRIKPLIDFLKASCLLLQGNNNETVKMHDIAHVVVASIAKEKRMFNIQDANGFKEVLVKGMYKDSITIILHHGDLDGLPERYTFHVLPGIRHGVGLVSRCNNNETVKMHDSAHMVVALIAKEKHMFNIQDANGFKEVLVKEMYRDSIAICLHHGDIDGLPERVNFSNLQLLVLCLEKVRVIMPGRMRYVS
ncbi:hypothetical protein Patl1_07045 [Pistacia atlantica]|uniref:Uncharacterized protein n=1 Tax=Pistacia atlantica TaxID=434234 RepID=A0ACC1AFZ0_9ROSI|nr:hypothetical protein Patl1_07045 [Pistacia atlantica]